MNKICTAIGLLFSLTLSVAVSAKEKVDAATKETVTQAIQTAFPGAKVKKIKKAVEKDIEFYGVAFVVQGKKMDGDVTAEGILLETEEPAELNTFPEPAVQALKKAAEGATIKAYEINRKFAKAEKDPKSGVVKVTKLPVLLIAYEADLEKDGKKGEVGVTADGTVVESPEWSKNSK